jgi:hypothetical protein
MRAAVVAKRRPAPSEALRGMEGFASAWVKSSVQIGTLAASGMPSLVADARASSDKVMKSL